jgi:hypothetical protein
MVRKIVNKITSREPLLGSRLTKEEAAALRAIAEKELSGYELSGRLHAIATRIVP